jgi:RNA repair, ligase-Pnkp-associating, region of Hen1
VQLRLTGSLKLAEALNHLYVLLPVLDDAKHYWVSEDEVDKLLRAGAGWLAGHPAKELITRRYLANRRSLTQSALERLRAASDELDAAPEPHEVDEVARVEAAERRNRWSSCARRRCWRRLPSPAQPGCSTWAVGRARCCWS